MDKRIIICACDTSGVMAEPFIKDGWEAWLIDPDHNGRMVIPENYTLFPMKFQEWLEIHGNEINDRVGFFAGFPVCTELSYAGARWFDEKRQADPYFQLKALELPIKCIRFAERLGCPFFIENPNGVIKYAFGESNHVFNPCDYAGYCDEEIENAYTKETHLWTGGGFVMPEPKPCDPKLVPHKKDSKTNMQSMDSHFERMGKTACRTGATRSETPRGFSRAVFEANIKINKGANQ